MSPAVDSFAIPLTYCARCGRNHERVKFKKFAVPCGEWTHWGFCPNTGEPVLLKHDGPVLLTPLEPGDPRGPQ